MDKESSENYSDFTVSTIGGIVGLGIVNGLVTFGLANLLDKFIIGPALCKSASVNICNDSLVYAYHVAAVFAGILAVVWLVRLFDGEMQIISKKDLLSFDNVKIYGDLYDINFDSVLYEENSFQQLTNLSN
jgi:hypothetical protein